MKNNMLSVLMVSVVRASVVASENRWINHVELLYLFGAKSFRQRAALSTLSLTLHHLMFSPSHSFTISSNQWPVL